MQDIGIGSHLASKVLVYTCSLACRMSDHKTIWDS